MANNWPSTSLFWQYIVVTVHISSASNTELFVSTEGHVVLGSSGEGSALTLPLSKSVPPRIACVLGPGIRVYPPNKDVQDLSHTCPIPLPLDVAVAPMSSLLE